MSHDCKAWPGTCRCASVGYTVLGEASRQRVFLVLRERHSYVDYDEVVAVCATEEAAASRAAAVVQYEGCPPDDVYYTEHEVES